MTLAFEPPEGALDIARALFLFFELTQALHARLQGYEHAHQSDSISGRCCGIAYTAHVCRVGAGSDCQLPRHHSPPCTRTGATRTGKPVARPRSPSVLPWNTDEWSLGSAIRGEGCCVFGARMMEKGYKSSLTGRIRTMNQSGAHAGRTPRTITHAPFAGGTVRENHWPGTTIR